MKNDPTKRNANENTAWQITYKLRIPNLSQLMSGSGPHTQ